MQCFPVFNRQKNFEAGAKTFWTLESELEPNILELDDSRWSQSLKFEFRLHSKALVNGGPHRGRQDRIEKTH